MYLTELFVDMRTTQKFHFNVHYFLLLLIRGVLRREHVVWMVTVIFWVSWFFFGLLFFQLFGRQTHVFLFLLFFFLLTSQTKHIPRLSLRRNQIRLKVFRREDRFHACLIPTAPMGIGHVSRMVSAQQLWLLEDEFLVQVVWTFF